LCEIGFPYPAVEKFGRIRLRAKPDPLAQDPDRQDRTRFGSADKPTANALLLPKREPVERILSGNSI